MEPQSFNTLAVVPNPVREMLAEISRSVAPSFQDVAAPFAESFRAKALEGIAGVPPVSRTSTVCG